MPETITFKPKFLQKFMYAFEAFSIPLGLVYLWLVTRETGWIIVRRKYGGEMVYYNFYTYIIAILLLPYIIGNIKKYLTLKKCKIVFDNEKIHLYILKRKYLTSKQKKGLINKIKCSFYPIVNNASNSEYYNIPITKTILYKDINAVDIIKNLKVKMTYSHTNDLGIITKNEKYFIDSTLYSKKNIELIKKELIKRSNI